MTPLLSVEDPSLRLALETISPSSSPASTPFTSSTEASPTAELRASRPAIMLSSTSWTADEDFSLLIEALSLYARSESSPPAPTPSKDASDGSADDWVHASINDDDVAPPPPTPPRAPKNSRLPDLICFVTGRGPLRTHYLSLLNSRAATEGWLSPPAESGRPRVSVHSVWLDDPDYPKLLGCADLGVSLHVSSSGLDLPMKVVDCFGCGVPVLAKDFAWSVVAVAHTSVCQSG